MSKDFISQRIEMAASGLLPSHGPDFRIDHPDGHREYGCVYFHAPVVLEDCDGQLARPGGTAIFYRPENPRFYYPVEGSLQHTWFLAAGPGIDLCLREFKIPTFTALPLNELQFLETFIADVRHEGVPLQEHYEDAITDLFCDFFRKVGVLLAENSGTITSAQHNKIKILNEIRLHVHSDIARKWTVGEMAEMEGLNSTRFALEYRAQFGTSPIDDLIDARVNRAEYMLTHLSYTVKQIARDCGFNSEEHFSRVFHSRRGCSPGQLRKRSGIQ